MWRELTAGSGVLFAHKFAHSTAAGAVFFLQALLRVAIVSASPI